ncbi:MAG: hypothetical protein ACI4QM_04820 [Alphaproteobacteria bacterium]
MKNTNNKKRMYRSDESGRSLVEMLGTIAIITMITIGGITGINIGMQMYRVGEAQNDVEQLIQGVDDIYSWERNPTYANLQRRACENDLIAKECFEDQTGWNSAFGTDMFLETAGSDYRVVIENIPHTACVLLQSREFILSETPEGDCGTNKYALGTLFFYPKR